MKKILFAFTATSFLMIASIATVKAQTETPVVTPPPVAVATSDIVGVATGSQEHTMLVEAINTAGVLKTFQLNGPFTVFAPTNAAFEKLPAGTVETLVKPENKATLTAVLTYHVVAGRLDAKEIARLIKEGNGKAELTTVQGGKLWLWMKDKTLWIKDEKGGMASVTIKDVYQSNGVIHVIDAVVLPKG